MTLSPEKIGDKGQRFEIRYFEDGAEHVMGWSDNRTGADNMATAWLLRPGVESVWVIDRVMKDTP